MSAAGTCRRDSRRDVPEHQPNPDGSATCRRATDGPVPDWPATTPLCRHDILQTPTAYAWHNNLEIMSLAFRSYGAWFPAAGEVIIGQTPRPGKDMRTRCAIPAPSRQ